MVVSIIEFAASLGIRLSAYQETLLRLVYGLPLTPEQVEIARGAAGLEEVQPRTFRVVSVLAGRRSGKSLLAALIITYESVVAEHEIGPDDSPVVLLVAPSKMQARQTGRRVLNLLKRSRFKSQIVGKPKDGVNDFNIQLKNGIEIRALGATPELLRGYKLIVALLEECAFFADDETMVKNDREIVEAVSPGLDTPQSKMIRISSPDARSGVMFDDYAHRAERPNVLCWKATTREMNPDHDLEGQALAKERDPIRYGVEYEAEFAETASALVPAEKIEAAVLEGHTEIPPQAGKSYVVVLDPAQRNDWFAFSICHAEEITRGGQPCTGVVQDYAQFWKRSKLENFLDMNLIIPDVVSTLHRYGVRKVYSDQVGAAFLSAILQKDGIKFEHVFTGGTKAALKFDTARRLFIEGRVAILDVPEQTQQLKKLQDVHLGGGRRSVAASSGHDDIAVCLCAAIHLAATEQPQENFEPFVIGGAPVYDNRPARLGGC